MIFICQLAILTYFTRVVNCSFSALRFFFFFSFGIIFFLFRSLLSFLFSLCLHLLSFCSRFCCCHCHYRSIPLFSISIFYFVHIPSCSRLHSQSSAAAALSCVHEIFDKLKWNGWWQTADVFAWIFHNNINIESKMMMIMMATTLISNEIVLPHFVCAVHLSTAPNSFFFTLSRSFACSFSFSSRLLL